MRLGKSNNATKFSITNSSRISAKKIFFSSPTTKLTIDGTSLIEVNGRSTNTRGTWNKMAGATYLGQGGYCGTNQQDEKFYGQFFMQPNSGNMYDMMGEKLIGSIGTIDVLATAGGGHVHIDVDSLNLTGKGVQIQANGLPA